MSRIIARLLPHTSLFLVGLLILGIVDSVHAQNIAVSKDLCSPSGCISQNQSTLPSVPPYTAASYPITLVNNGATALNVDLQETFQPGFHYDALASTCGQANPALTGGNLSTYLGPLTLPPMTTTTCVIYGWFEYLPASQNNANNVVTVYDSADTAHQTSLAVSNLINATVDGTAPIPTDMALTKSATITSTDTSTGAVTVHYTIVITNSGPNDVYGFLLQDRLSLPASGVPLTASYVGSSSMCTLLPGSGSSTCFGPAPSISNSPLTVSSTNLADFLQWSYPVGTTGLLKAGGSMKIEFDVTIAPLPGLHCVRDPAGNWLFNAAHIGFNLPGSTTTIQDSNPSNNTATASVQLTIDAPVDPTCGTPALQVTKTQDTPQLVGGFPWGSTISYTITLTNNSTIQTIGNIQLFDAINGSLGDLVQAGVGTPPFTAELVAWTCLSQVCTSSQSPAGNTQLLTGYGDTQWMFGTTVYAPPNVTDLAPGASVSMQLQIKYRDPGCDSYPGVALKPVLNFVRAAYQDSALGNVVVQSPPVTAYMQASPACQFTIQKAVNGGLNKITFDSLGTPAPVSYTVTFGNPTSQIATIGTLIDALRIKQSAYATQLPVDYSYTCAPSPSGVTGYPASGSGSVNVIYTILPQMGVRIIQNTGPVTFQPQSTLTCTVTIKVHRPSAGDPNCARLGELENTAIMDTSAFYNSNLPWPAGTTPGNAAQASLPLPQCLNLVINKFVTPIWATQNGGPLHYTLKVTNLGFPIIPADGVTLSDNFTPSSYAASTPWTAACNPLSSGTFPCTFAWLPNPLSNPSTLTIKKLSHNQEIITKFPVKRPYPAPPGHVCNHAEAAVAGIAAGNWYAKNPATWQTDLCVPIFDVRSLDINKAVTITPPATTPPVTTFTVNVACSYLVNGVQYGPNATVSFTFPPTPGTQTVPNIPVGSICTIAEQQPLPPPVAMSSCPSGFGGWGPVTYPNPVGPGTTPQSLTIVTTAPNRLEVQNTFACVPVGMLSVTKTFDASSPASQFPATATFPVQVACTGRPTTTVNLTSPNFQQTVPNIPMGSICTITELAPVGTDVQSNCHWDTSYPKSQSVTIPNGTANLEARNKLSCTGTLTVYKTFDPSSLGTQMPATASFPILIACPGFTTTANLGSGNNFQFVTPSLPTGTVCTITELTPLNAPIPPNCQWAATTYPKGLSVTIPNGTSSLVAQNSLSCIPSTTASLTVSKTTTNLSAITMPNPQFPVTVDCQPGGPSTTLSLTPNAGSQLASNIPAGSNCTITEMPPPMLPPTPAYCRWVTSLIWGGVSHPNGSQITNVQGLPDPRSIEVRNDFICNPPPPGGTLTVKKTIIYDTINITSQQMGNFQVMVSCVNPASLQTITLTHANNYQASLPNLPIGAQCTVVESLPQNPSVLPAGSQWVATYPSGQQATIQAGNQTFMMKNERMNNTVPPGQSMLIVTKNFAINGAFDPNHTMTFQVVASCTSSTGSPVSGFPQSVNLTPSYTIYLDGSIGAVTYSSSASFNVPVGSTCTINEPVLPPLSANLSTCSWAGIPTYWSRGYGGGGQAGASITLSVAQQGYELQVNNPLVCPPMLIVQPPGHERFDVSVKTASPGEWFSGSAGVFNLVVSNNGAAIESPAKISVNDNLPAEMKFVAAAGNGWICGSSVPVTCTYSGAVSSGKSLPPIAITAIAGKQGKAENCARVSLQGAQDRVSANDRNCVTVRIGNARTNEDSPATPAAYAPRADAVDVGIVNTATGGRWPAGGTGTFALTVTNYGAPLGNGAGMEVQDTLPAGLLLQSAVTGSSAWRCQTKGNNLRCSRSGIVQTGAQPAIRVTARATRAGTFNNCATVSLSAANDTTPSNNTSCATLRVGLDAGQEPTAPPALIMPPPRTEPVNKPAQPDASRDKPPPRP